MEQVFKDNPHLKECWQTSDGKPFFNENSAKMHAKSLKDKNIKHLTRGGSDDEGDKEPSEEELEIKKVKALQLDPLKAYAAKNFPELQILEEDKKPQIQEKVIKAITDKFTKTEE